MSRAVRISIKHGLLLILYRQQQRTRRVFTNAFEELGYDDTQLHDTPAAAKLSGYTSGHDSAAIDELEQENVAERSDF